MHQCLSEFVCSRSIYAVAEKFVNIPVNDGPQVSFQQFLAKAFVLCKFEIQYLVKLQDNPISVFVRVAESNAPSVSKLNTSPIFPHRCS